MSSTTATRIAAVMGFLAVAFGAFGAHGLKDTLVAMQTLAIWEKAVFYHFIHTVMLFVLASRPVARGAWFCFLIGVLAFSGSLYVLALTSVKWLVWITPLGGLSLLAGWFLLFLHAGKLISEKTN